MPGYACRSVWPHSPPLPRTGSRSLWAPADLQYRWRSHHPKHHIPYEKERVWSVAWKWHRSKPSGITVTFCSVVIRCSSTNSCFCLSLMATIRKSAGPGTVLCSCTWPCEPAEIAVEDMAMKGVHDRLHPQVRSGHTPHSTGLGGMCVHDIRFESP